MAHKLMALRVVREIGLKPAARQLNLPVTSLKRWQKNEEEFVTLSSKRGFDPTKNVSLSSLIV
jgi:hypothetical protein